MTNKSIDPRLLKLLTETFKLHSQESQYNIKETTVSLPLVEETAQGIEADLLALVGEDEPTMIQGKNVPYKTSNTTGRFRNTVRRDLRKAIQLYCRGSE